MTDQPEASRTETRPQRSRALLLEPSARVSSREDIAEFIFKHLRFGLGVFCSMTGIVSGEQITAFIATVCLILLAAGFYFVPTFVANDQNPGMRDSVFIVNLFFGWTAIGWVVAFAMAALPPKHETQARI